MIDTLLAGRYRIQSQLGEGGMAIVYKAMDIVLHRVVAIKVLRPQYAGDDEFVERFRREAQAAASLSHPNVVNIFDVGEAGGVHYIVLEYVQGQNLKQIVREEGRLVPRRAARIAAAVARALQAAHERQLVHRDIKPHNILITPEGRVKVTDFGIARATSASTLTEAGMVIGSVHYFSPEQARGQAVGPAADLYSLGVVLYEMLTGRVPFDGDSPVAVALKHLQDTPRPPREIVNAIPSWLEQVVLKALAKDPARRYRSASQMAVDLAWRTADVPVNEAEETADSRPSVSGGAGVQAAGAGASDLVAAREMLQRGVPERGVLQRAGDRFGRRPARTDSVGAEPRGFDPSRRPPPLMSDDADSNHTSRADDSAAAHEDAEERPKSGRWRRFFVTMTVLLLVGAAVYAATPLLLDIIFPPEVDVPGVTGLTYDEARPLMRAVGLSLTVEAEVFDPDVPEGAIVRQSPDAGRTVRQGREISIVLSRGPDMGQVPDVTGLPLRDARISLLQAGYTLADEIEQHDTDAPVNEVVRQEPLPGTQLEKRSSVTLWVSKPGVTAGQTVAVPDFRGKPLSAAEAELIELGLVPGHRWPELSPLVPPGRVIDQNPAAGAVVEVGTDIDFVYSDDRLADVGRGTTPDASGTSGTSGASDAPGQTESGTDVSPDSAAAPDPETGPRFRLPFGLGTGRDSEPDEEESAAEDRFPWEDVGDVSDTPGAASDEEGGGKAENDIDWEAVLQAESGDRSRRWARVDVYIPPGAPREVVVLVIDDFGLREVFRQTVPGDTDLQQLIDGRGDGARLQVYIDGVMQVDESFPDS